MPKLLIVDSHAILFKAHFAFIKRQLKNSRGRTTSALFGFLKVVFELLEQFGPDQLCFAFDTSRDTFRREIYPQYKAHRSETPEELLEQLPLAPQLAEALGATILKKDGYEADDILGTLAKSAICECPETEVLIVTGDKDLFQLIEPRVRIGYTSSRASKGVEIVDEQGFMQRYDGLQPLDLITIKALMGDSSDNIPGIAGIGEKTALKLVKEYKTLENLYDHLDAFKGKMREKIENGRENAFLSRQLATIVRDVKLDISLKDLQFSFQPSSELIAMLEDLEFTSFLKKWSAKAASETPAPLAQRNKSYRLIQTREDLQNLVHQLSQKAQVAIDTETTSLRVHEARLVGIALSDEADCGYYLPVHHRAPGSRNLSLKELQEALNPCLQNENIQWIGHNLKYDFGILKQHGLQIPKRYFDTMIAAHLLHPDMRIGLKELALNLLREERPSYAETAGKDGDFSLLHPNHALEYAASDADNTFRLMQRFQPQLETRSHLQQLLETIELPLIPILEAMENRGIRINRKHFQNLIEELSGESSRLAKLVLKEAGEDFNLNSPKQLAHILFEKLEIPHGKKTKTGYSTATDVLEELAEHYPICRNILDYRHMQKLLSTYAEPLAAVADKEQRIHTTFNQTIVATGRLSSNHPNLQNIPVRTRWGRRIREGFLASEGFHFVSIDYSQIELRVMAHLAEDSAMIQAFNDQRDIHTETAARIFQRKHEEITKSERESAKAINFGIIYGISPFGLSRQLGIQVPLAKGFIENYFKVYEGIQRFMQNTAEMAETQGAVQTMYGRERKTSEASSKNKNRRDSARRMAINTVVQGSAAEILKLAMIEIHTMLQALQSRMLLQVHDELIFEIHENEVDSIEKIRQIMENICPLKVPLVCDVETGPNWGEMDAYSGHR